MEELQVVRGYLSNHPINFLFGLYGEVNVHGRPI